MAQFVERIPSACRLILPAHPAADQPGLTSYPSTAPDLTIQPDDLAYIAFTSGTTGRPRAIQGTHRPLSHFIQWHRQQFGFEDKDRFSMLSGLAHDPLLRDIFTPLATGAALCIPDLDVTVNGFRHADDLYPVIKQFLGQKCGIGV